MKNDFESIGTILAGSLLSDTKENKDKFMEIFYKTFKSKFPEGVVKVVVKKYGDDKVLYKTYYDFHNMYGLDRKDVAQLFYFHFVAQFGVPHVGKANSYLYRFRQRGLCLRAYFPEYPVGLCLFIQSCKKSLYEKHIAKIRELR